MEQYHNAYTYTASDPINRIDPTGCADCKGLTVAQCNDIVEKEQKVSDASSPHHTGSYANLSEENLESAVSLGYSTVQDYTAAAEQFRSAAARINETLASGANRMQSGDIALAGRFGEFSSKQLEVAAMVQRSAAGSEYALQSGAFSALASGGGSGSAFVNMQSPQYKFGEKIYEQSYEYGVKITQTVWAGVAAGTIPYNAWPPQIGVSINGNGFKIGFSDSWRPMSQISWSLNTAKRGSLSQKNTHSITFEGLDPRTLGTAAVVVGAGYILYQTGGVAAPVLIPLLR